MGGEELSFDAKVLVDANFWACVQVDSIDRQSLVGALFATGLNAYDPK